MGVLENQICPICKEKTLVLTEQESEVPFFGKVYLFSMTCSSCKYHKADVETANEGEPTKYSLDITSAEDMKIRVVKSAEATVKVPYVSTIESGPTSNGYVTNVEGILARIKRAVEIAKEDAEDEEEKKKAKNMLKKINKIIWGQEKAKLIIEDPTGNSAIISDKAKKEKLKV